MCDKSKGKKQPPKKPEMKPLKLIRESFDPNKIKDTN